MIARIHSQQGELFSRAKLAFGAVAAGVVLVAVTTRHIFASIFYTTNPSSPNATGVSKNSDPENASPISQENIHVIAPVGNPEIERMKKEQEEDNKRYQKDIERTKDELNKSSESIQQKIDEQAKLLAEISEILDDFDDILARLVERQKPILSSEEEASPRLSHEVKMNCPLDEKAFKDLPLMDQLGHAQFDPTCCNHVHFVTRITDKNTFSREELFKKIKNMKIRFHPDTIKKDPNSRELAQRAFVRIEPAMETLLACLPGLK